MFPERSSIGDSAQERITLEEDQKGSLSSSWIKTATIDLDDGQFRHLQRQTKCFGVSKLFAALLRLLIPA